jgi:hypothetical protein
MTHDDANGKWHGTIWLMMTMIGKRGEHGSGNEWRVKWMTFSDWLIDWAMQRLRLVDMIWYEICDDDNHEWANNDWNGDE